MRLQIHPLLPVGQSEWTGDGITVFSVALGRGRSEIGAGDGKGDVRILLHLQSVIHGAVHPAALGALERVDRDDDVDGLNGGGRRSIKIARENRRAVDGRA